MGLYSEALIIGGLFANDIWGAYIRGGLFGGCVVCVCVGGGGGGGLSIGIFQYLSTSKYNFSCDF